MIITIKNKTFGISKQLSNLSQFWLENDYIRIVKNTDGFYDIQVKNHDGFYDIQVKSSGFYTSEFKTISNNFHFRVNDKKRMFKILEKFSSWCYVLSNEEIENYDSFKDADVIFNPQFFIFDDVKDLIDYFEFGLILQYKLFYETIAYVISIKNPSIHYHEHKQTFFVNGKIVDIELIKHVFQKIPKNKRVITASQGPPPMRIPFRNVVEYMPRLNDCTVLSIYPNNNLMVSRFGNVLISYYITKIEEKALYNSKDIFYIMFTFRIVKIGKHAFENCRNLENIRLPNSICEIDDYAFRNCNSLSNIDFYCSYDTEASYGKLRIGKRAFENCYNIKTFCLSDNILDGIKFKKTLKTTSVIVAEQAFLNCYQLQQIRFPFTRKRVESSLIKIGKNAFENCKELKIVSFPAYPTSTFTSSTIEIDESIDKTILDIERPE